MRYSHDAALPCANPGELDVVSAGTGAKSTDMEASVEPDHLTDLFQAAEGDHGDAGISRGTSGKLFIGGLSWETTEATLSSHFGKFGELTDGRCPAVGLFCRGSVGDIRMRLRDYALPVVVMKNRANGQPRGFGFVTFRDPAVARAILSDAHVLDGRTVEVKVAVPKEDCPPK